MGFQMCVLALSLAGIATVDGGETRPLAMALIVAIALSPSVRFAPAPAAFTTFLSMALYVGLQLTRTASGENHLPEAFAALFSFPVVALASRATWMGLSSMRSEVRETAGAVGPDVEVAPRDTSALDADAVESVEVLSIRERVTRPPIHLEVSAILADEIRRASRYNTTVSLAVLDIADWDQVFADIGPEMAKELLKRGDDIVCRLVRDLDKVCRHRASQMAVIMPETPLPGARIAAERICQEMAQAQVEVHLGLAEFPQDGATSESLLAEAEAALEFAKAAGLRIADRSLVSWSEQQAVGREPPGFLLQLSVPGKHSGTPRG